MPGIIDLWRTTCDYWIAVQRVRRMAVTEADKLGAMADLELLYRRERVAKLGALLAQLPTETGTAYNIRQ
jgi:hypothetical protein